MSGAIKREQGETFASFAARQKAQQDAERAMLAAHRRPRRPRRKIHRSETYEDRLDDIGLSPDF
jgi:hypothetical protein